MRHTPLLLTGLLALSAAQPALARPAHKKALADYLGPFLAARLNDCRTCHLPDPPGKREEDEEKPHNAFGKRLREARVQLRKAGKPADLPAALDAVADEDSDGDGVPNLLELLAGHGPGEAKDVPPPARVAEAREGIVAFRRGRSGYAWAPFDRVRRPEVPRVKSAGWVRNPVDAFIAAEHEARGLTPRPEAGRAVLLRRVYLDLVGLPPTPAELHASLADDSPGAYERVVDRLLASPQYGERWGRHWMDVWRYSDWAGWTGGGQIRDSQPHVWRWRDWIVESLNADKGYDRMVLEMLAADELAPEDPDALRATGYLVRNYKMLSREKWLQDTVEHTAMAFLGLTVGCARCHDHMFDPITQREYYQLRSVFEPHQVRTDRVPGQADVKKDGLVRAYDADLTSTTYLFVRGDDRTPDRSKVIPPGVPQSLGGEFKVEPVKLPAFAVAPDRRPFVVADERRAGEEAVAQAKAALEAARKGSAEALALAATALSAAEVRHESLLLVLRAEELIGAGKKDTMEWKKVATDAAAAQRRATALDAARAVLAAEQALAKAAPGMKAVASRKVELARKALERAEAEQKGPPTTAYAPRPLKTYPATSTGRRLAFARWVTSRDNPLTARVAVNHVWLRHFGQAIVPRVFDFGRNGRPPSHPALLDWLAVELMDRGWSMKEMHRLLVTSSTYRMASTPDEANVAADRDNVYLWRMPSRRLEAELVRDAVYFVAGRLDRTMGGPDLDHALGLTLPRRSLYFRHAAEKQMEFLKLFDAASVAECYQRKESVLPQQALALLNSELTRRHGRLLARRIAAESKGDAEKFTVSAFEYVLSRPPTPAEVAECATFLKEQTRRYATRKAGTAGGSDAEGRQPPADPALRAREGLVQVLLNHNDFVTVR